jgi:hypothetical protein
MSVLRCFNGGAPPVLGLKLTMDLGRVGGFARAPR